MGLNPRSSYFLKRKTLRSEARYLIRSVVEQREKSEKDVLKSKISLPYLIYFLKAKKLKAALEYIISRYKYYRKKDLSKDSEVLLNLNTFINKAEKKKKTFNLKILVYSIELYLNEGHSLCLGGSHKAWKVYYIKKVNRQKRLMRAEQLAKTVLRYNINSTLCRKYTRELYLSDLTYSVLQKARVNWKLNKGDKAFPSLHKLVKKGARFRFNVLNMSSLTDSQIKEVHSDFVKLRKGKPSALWFRAQPYHGQK